jgi:hypothetical protein
MADLVLVLAIVGLFALCGVYVAWCDRLVGPDPSIIAAATSVEESVR